MSPRWIALCCAVLWTACTVAPAVTVAPRPAAAQKTRKELVEETNAVIDSIAVRLSERGLAAAIASEHVAVLDQRASRLRERCEQLPPRDRAELIPHLEWLDQVHSTTTLSIGVLRNDSRDFDEDKATVLLWTKVFMKEIDSLERRIDRVAPVNVLFSQRTGK